MFEHDRLEAAAWALLAMRSPELALHHGMRLAIMRARDSFAHDAKKFLRPMIFLLERFIGGAMLSPSDGTNRPEREGKRRTEQTARTCHGIGTRIMIAIWQSFGWMAAMALPFVTALALWHGVNAVSAMCERIGERMAQRRRDRARQAASAARLARLRRMLAA